MSLSGFSERLKELMEMEGISRRALAIKTGLQRKSLLNWLNGINYPRYDALIKLADFFKVKTDYLLHIGNENEYEKCKTRCPIESVPVQFREKIKYYMEEEKITKYALAKKLNIGQTTLERWFSGNAMPETVTLIKLTAITGESLDYLLGRE